ncbi:lipopolysaccharide biosynthesis protein [Paralimibaculum aggregatum]|uniref:Lipopolysaccharide biosynthesis protein n=1 Tax=Paralimibaculum aggregatum TaxID=3036245 RepID=A0ABQ6LQN4_9RHOB|nr:lipopolysaccharide biosynthesis protein [Limibaculum sp. NKW23]GMG84352.1 lipopolysaccharide biosynthesis protein [Limibaculum sp. NKW23]
MTRAERNARALAAADASQSIGRRAAQGAGIALAAQALRLTIQMGATACLARLLLPEDFGLYAMALTLTGMVLLFTDLGLAQATVQRPEIDQKMVSGLFLLNLAMAGAVVLATAALAPLLVRLYGAPEVGPLALVVATAAVFNALGAQHRALLMRGMRWVALQRADLLGQFGGSLLAVLLAWGAGAGYWALAVQPLATAALASALLWRATDWRPSLVRDLRPAREAIRFGLNYTGFNLLNHFQRNGDNMLIGWFWGAGPLGFYTRAYNLMMLPVQALRGPVSSALIPALSRLQDRPEEWRALLLDAAGLLAVATAGVGALLVAAAPEIVAIVYGPGWERAATVMTWLAGGVFATALADCLGWIYLSLGRTRRMLLWTLLGTAPAMLGAFALAVPHGIETVALTFSVVMLALVGPGLFVACRGTPVSWLAVLRMTGPYALGGFAVGAALALAAPWAGLPGAALRLGLDAAAIGAAQAAMLALWPAIDPAHRRMRTRALRQLGALRERLARRRAGGPA